MKRFLLACATVVTLFVGTLLPVNFAQAEKPSQLVTCINLADKSERISHTGKCRITQEAQANWHVLSSDSRLPEKGKSKLISICSNKPTSPVTYQIIRAKCASHQIRTDYFRSTLVNAAPTITHVVATGYDSAQVALANVPNPNPDAPVAYYTITSDKGQSKNIYTWGELNLTIDNLSELTTYSFTVTATTADGTSKVSATSDSVTTTKYVAPLAPLAPASAAPPVAQVSFISSDTASITIPAGATSVAVSAPTLGNPSLSFGSQAASVSATISSVANPAGGSSTPFTVSGSTKIVDIAVSGLSGSATVCLDASPTARLWHFVGGTWVDITSSQTSTQVCGLTSSFSPFTGEEQLPAPAFALSTSSLSGNQGSRITSVTATKAAHTQTVTYSISPVLPTGLSISSITGTISGTPTTTSLATNYVMTATNAASGTATRTLAITVNAALTCAQGGACSLGEVGPGGGKVFYVSANGFKCGPSWTITGSPTGGLCYYLEAAPISWNGGTEVTRQWSNRSRNAVIPNIEFYDDSVGSQSLYKSIDNLGKGFANSSLTVALYADDAVYAAAKARACRLGSKTDWYLPNNAELFQMITNLRGANGDFASTHPYYYWSSTEAVQPSNPGRTGFMAFIAGFFDANGPYYTTYADDVDHYVRPIRAF